MPSQQRAEIPINSLEHPNFRLTFRTSLMETIYAGLPQKLLASLVMLVRLNTKEYLGYNPQNSYLIHEGAYYFSELETNTVDYTAVEVRLLPNYIEQFSELTKESIELQKEMDMVQRFIINVLNKANTKADIYALMPSNLADYLPPGDSGVVSLSPEEIKDFQDHNEVCRNQLGRRILTNFLTRE